jgi:thiol-disulfide isomerase/thioredoxin
VKRTVAIGIAALLALGCESEKPRESSVTAERSQAVQGPASQPATATAVVASAAPAPSATPKARRALCGGRLDSEGRAMPTKKPIGRRAAPGASELPAEPSYNGFTWVNFWAAWCVPCKEEIPRLLSWQARLRAKNTNFRVLFVSLDDDERQLTSFLGSQPEAGLRSTYWLHEGREREDWLLAAGVDPDPDLPQHLLVDSKGKVRCRVRGAIEDSDYETLLNLVGP